MKPLSPLLWRSFPLVAIVALALVSLQCIEKPLEPIAPSAEIQLSIPLVDITKTLDEAFTKDTSSVKRDVMSGGYYFTDTQVAQPTKLDSIRVMPTPSLAQVALDTFQVSPIPPVGFGLPGSILPFSSWPTPPLPASTPFPGLTTTVPGGSLPSLSGQFDFLAVRRGSLTITVRNTLPLTVRFPKPIRLKNNNASPFDTSTIAVFAIDSLTQGQSKSVSASLANKLVRGTLKSDSLTLAFSSRPGPFTVNSTDSLTFSFSSSAFTVDSARAVIPSQQIASIDDSVIVIDDSVSLASASFRSGRFVARVTNNLDVNVGVRLRFENFKNPVTQNVLTIDQVFTPRKVDSFTVRLDTVNLVNTNSTTSDVGTRMMFSASIQTINSSGGKATVSSKDFVRAEFLPRTDLVIKSVTGRIKPTTQIINSGASGVNLGEASENFKGLFTFDSVRLAVNLGVTGGFPTGYDLILKAENRKTGAKDSLVLPPPTGSGTRIIYPSGNTMTRIELGNTQGLNTFLSRFFPSLPDTFIIKGSVVLNPGFVQETIADTSKIYQSVNMYFPLKVGIANGRLESKQPMGDSTSKFPTEFANDVKRTSINMSITNGLPVQLAFSARMLGWVQVGTSRVRDTVLRIPTDNIARTIVAATVDANGNAATPQTSNFSLSLSDTDVKKFNSGDSLYIRLDMVTPANTGLPGFQAVRFRQTDRIRVRMSGNMVYIVNKQN